MNRTSLLELGDYINNFVIPDIPEDTNFWLIRTMSGYFYKEFIKKEFVALGWNFIDSKTSFSKKDIEILKEHISERYGDSRPGVTIRKCMRFIEEVKPGDYIMIPHAGGTEVTVALAGEYYESDFDYWKEIEAVKKIQNRESEIGTIKCPYKKRRKIKTIMTISSSRLGYKIQKGLSSYHGISNMSDYAIDILNCIYDCYTYKGNMMCSFNIAKREPIKARELAKLMYGVTELFCNLIEEDLISITVNLNSPGKLTILLKDGYEKLKKGVYPLLAIYFFVFGGSAFGFDFPGLAGGVINLIEECRTMNIKIEMEKEELKGKQLENYKSAMELIEMSESTDIDMKKVLDDLKLIDELDDSLRFESNKEFAVSDQEKEEK